MALYRRGLFNFIAMKITAKQRTLLNRMILHSMDNPDTPGLMAGLMGAVIVTSQCARQWNMPDYDLSADFLYDRATRNMNRLSKTGFAMGMPGICWGVEYLVQHGLLPGTADEICSSVDSGIMEIDVRRLKDFSLATGARGMWLYVQARIQGNNRAGLALPFDDVYLHDWITLIDNNRDKFPSGTLQWLESALTGDVQHVRLSVMPLITNFKTAPKTNLSLHNGIAGYIATHYLVNV